MNLTTLFTGFIEQHSQTKKVNHWLQQAFCQYQPGLCGFYHNVKPKIERRTGAEQAVARIIKHEGAAGEIV